MARPHHVYILTNLSGCYYVGMTSDLCRRWFEHHTRAGGRFTRRFNVQRLVYVAECPDRESAARHERSLKRRTRARKAALIRSVNPNLEDLSVVWGWRSPPDSLGPRTR
jgi:putative endonuclease